MNMSGPPSVESRINGLELDNPLIVGIEPSAEEGIHVDSIGRASHAAVASVITSSVGTPNLYKGIGEGLAGGAVDHTNIEDEGRATESKVYRVNMAQRELLIALTSDPHGGHCGGTRS